MFLCTRKYPIDFESHPESESDDYRTATLAFATTASLGGVLRAPNALQSDSVPSHAEQILARSRMTTTS